MGLKLALDLQVLGVAENLGQYMDLSVKKFAFWVGEMARQVKTLAAKPDNPYSLPSEGENQLLQIVL